MQNMNMYKLARNKPMHTKIYDMCDIESMP